MELLLVLSAILTALTGAISGVRAPEAQIHRACGAVSDIRAMASARSAPVQGARTYLVLASGWQAPHRQVAPSAGLMVVLISSIPRYLDKLRN